MFITFEGVDGSGKTTQLELLRAALEKDGRRVVATREPGGTPLGERVRELLLNGAGMSAWAEAALFAAARAELVARVIRPSLEQGTAVLCDRYLDSSLAYQGVARKLGVERVLELSLAVSGQLLPERTFVLLLDPEVARDRAAAAPDRIEREDAGFRERVAGAYRHLVERFPDRLVPIDATRPAAEIAQEIHERVRELS